MKNWFRRCFCSRFVLCILTAAACVAAGLVSAYGADKNEKPAPTVSFRLNETGETEILMMHRFEPPPVEQIQQALEEALGCKIRDAKIETLDEDEDYFETEGQSSESQSTAVNQKPGYSLWSFTATGVNAFPRHNFKVDREIYLDPICSLLKSNRVSSITVTIQHPRYGNSHCTQGEEKFVTREYDYHYYVVPVDGSAPPTIKVTFGYESADLLLTIALPISFLIFPIALALFLRRTTLKAEGEKRQAAWHRLWKATSWIGILAWVGWSFIFSFPLMSEMLRLVFRSGDTAFDAGLNVGIYLMPPTFVIGLCYALTVSVNMRMRGIAYTRLDVLQHVLVEQVGSMFVILLFSMGVGSVFFAPRQGILLLASALIFAAIVGSLKRRFLNLAPYALEVGQLRDRIFEMARRCGVKLKQVYILPDDKMKTINAMASSGNYIILTNALLANLSQREVDSVVAHELGHLKHHHPHSLTTIFVVGVILINMGTGALWSLLGFDYGFSVCVLVFLFAIHWFSRKFEYTADIHSAYLMGDSRPLISALAEMSRLMMLPMSSDALSEKVSTHPYTTNRAKALARFGNVSPEELQLLVAAPNLDDERYDLKLIFGNSDRAFSTAAKQRISNRVSLILVAAKTIPPALIALVALNLGLSDPARLATYYAGLVATAAMYFALINLVPVLGCKAILKKLRDKLERERVGPTYQQGIFVGFSPAAETRYYESNDDWDLGYLFVAGYRLYYVGEQTRFTLSADQIRELNTASGSANWWRSERIFVTWLDSAQDVVKTFNMHPVEARSLTDASKKTRALAQQLREWKAAPTEPGAIPASLNGLSDPQIGEVTSHSLSEIAAPAKLFNLVFICLFCATVVSLALRLPFNPQRGGGALYVTAVTLIVTLLELIPLLRSHKKRSSMIAEQQRQPVASLEAIE